MSISITAKGALLLIGSEFFIALMSVIIKHLSEELPHSSLVFFRNLFGFIILFPFLLRSGLHSFKTDVLGLHFLRAFSGLLAMYCIFYILGHMHLAEAATLKLTVPFFIPIIAFLWLGESIPGWTKAAILVGFAGVIFILRPGTDAFQPLVFLGLAAAALGSFAKICIRKMGVQEPSHKIVFYFAFFSTSASLFPFLLHWQLPELKQWPWIVAMGLCGTLGQLLLTQAYQHANPGKIGPYVYSSVIFASLFGWLWWSEKLSISTAAGILLIVGSGLANLSLSKEQRKSNRVSVKS